MVWAPHAAGLELELVDADRRVALEPLAEGRFGTVLDDAPPGTRYRYLLPGRGAFPDPGARAQPEDVHGPSRVIDPAFSWSDAEWRGVPLPEWVIYELHVGSFSPEGTFAGVIPRLPRLKELGITVIELLPVIPNPGAHNWGYDGVYPYAVWEAYGGPRELKRLVDACHREGLGLVLDVVYNHLGPEGNYLPLFAPCFHPTKGTPWGPAINLDGEGAPGMRRFFRESALAWLTEFHVDGLRLDAADTLVDDSQPHFWAEVSAAWDAEAARLGREAFLIGEVGEDDPRYSTPREAGGHGLHGQWNDDLHHALHALLTDERCGYYQRFGELAQLAEAFRHGFVRRGPEAGRPYPHEPWRLVVCAQNHDQIGNRPDAARLHALLPPAAVRLAMAVHVLSPFSPLLFMGEEYGAETLFPFFVDHGDPRLLRAVRRGRREGFRNFGWPSLEDLDPTAPETFARAQLAPEPPDTARARSWLAYTRELLRARRELGPLETLAHQGVHEDEEGRVLLVTRPAAAGDAALLCHFGTTAAERRVPLPPGSWRLRLDANAVPFGGEGRAEGPLESSGELELRLPAFAAWLLFKR